MAFTVKDWQDAPSATTPISAAALEDMETRLSAYTDSTTASSLSGHLADETAHAASAITVAPTGVLTDTNVQAALATLAVSGGGGGGGTPAVAVDLSPQADGIGLITGAVTINMSGIADAIYAAKLSGNATLTITNMSRFASITFRLVQSTAGLNTVTFARSGGVVRWPQGSVAVLTSTAGAIDFYTGIGTPTGANLEMFTVAKDVR